MPDEEKPEVQPPFRAPDHNSPNTADMAPKVKLDGREAANADLHKRMAATPIATLFLDRELRVVGCTPSAVDLFQLMPGALGRPVAELARCVNFPELQTDAERVLGDLLTIDREVEDEKGRCFIARMLPHHGLGSHIDGVVITFVEITTDERSAKASFEGEARVAAIFNQAAAGISELTLEGRFLCVNPELCRLLGRSPEELLNMCVADVSNPEEAGACMAALSRIVETGCPETIEKRFMRPNGTAVWVSSTVARLDDAAGRPNRLLAVTVDLTARRKAEAALAQSEERLRLIVESAREYAIVTLDHERRVTSWNIGAERLLGYSEAEILGRLGDIIFTEEDRAAGAPAQEQATALREGRAADERWHLRKDRSRFWGSGSMMVMRGPSGEIVGFVKIFRDQTAARQAQQDLEQSRQELWEALQDNERVRAEVETAAAAKDHFLAVLSHELRTPLTPVLMTLHSLRRRRDLSPEVQESLELIRRNVQLEAHFIDELLDVTRISRGKLELNLAPLDFHEVTKQAIEIARPDLIEKAQLIQIAYDAGRTQILGDQARLLQVIWNVLKNASKFTPNGGKITVKTWNEGAKVLLEVSDTGIGIEPEALPQIFDAFAQGGEQVTREFGGLGLGLAIARAVAGAHGGTLRAQSGGKNKGSTFTLALPLAPSSKS